MLNKIKAGLMLTIGLTLAIGTSAALAMTSKGSLFAPENMTKCIFTYDPQATKEKFHIIGIGNFRARWSSIFIPQEIFDFLRDAQIIKTQKMVEDGSILIINKAIADKLIELLNKGLGYNNLDYKGEVTLGLLSLSNNSINHLWREQGLQYIKELGLEEEPDPKTIEEKLLNIVNTKTKTYSKPDLLVDDSSTFFGFDISTEQYGELKIPNHMIKLFNQCLSTCRVESYKYADTLLFPDINATLFALESIAYIFGNNILKWSPIADKKIDEEIKKKVWDYVTKKIKVNLLNIEDLPKKEGKNLFLKKDTSQDTYWIITNSNNNHRGYFFPEGDAVKISIALSKTNNEWDPVKSPFATTYPFSGKDKLEQDLEILQFARWRKLESPNTKNFGVFNNSFMDSLSNQMVFRLALGLSVDASYNTIENKLKELFSSEKAELKMKEQQDKIEKQGREYWELQNQKSELLEQIKQEKKQSLMLQEEIEKQIKEKKEFREQVKKQSLTSNEELAKQKIANSKLQEQLEKQKKEPQEKIEQQEKLAKTSFFDNIYENTKNMLLRAGCVMMASTFGTLTWAGLCKKENAYAGSICASIVTHELCKDPKQAHQGIPYLAMPTILGSYIGYKIAQKIMSK